ncbi:MAG: HIT domain-containing protein [bacterium]|nr:HIT domain-containing protein [bacterium]
MIDTSKTEDFYCDFVLNNKIEVEKVKETDNVLAYFHTRPHWPVHIVVIPKKHIPSLLHLGGGDNAILLELFDVIKEVADKVVKENGAARVLTNLGKYQDSKHLHFHVSSGEPLKK